MKLHCQYILHLYIYKINILTKNLSPIKYEPVLCFHFSYHLADIFNIKYGCFYLSKIKLEKLNFDPRYNQMYQEEYIEINCHCRTRPPLGIIIPSIKISFLKRKETLVYFIGRDFYQKIRRPSDWSLCKYFFHKLFVSYTVVISTCTNLSVDTLLKRSET